MLERRPAQRNGDVMVKTRKPHSLAKDHACESEFLWAPTSEGRSCGRPAYSRWSKDDRWYCENHYLMMEKNLEMRRDA